MSKIAMTLVFIGVTLAVGVWVNLELSETSFPSVLINETLAAVANNTWTGLAYKARSISLVGNNTTVYPTKSELGSAYWDWRHYGYETQVILYHNATSDFDVATASYNVTYNALNSSSQYIVMNATEGTSTLAQWLPIIMVVFAAAIIIAALMMWFGRR